MRRPSEHAFGKRAETRISIDHENDAAVSHTSPQPFEPRPTGCTTGSFVLQALP
jgi:hypothetical protein